MVVVVEVFGVETVEAILKMVKVVELVVGIEGK